MNGSNNGLVRYRGRLMSPAMALLIKESAHHNKARKYAPKNVDRAYISPNMADVQRLGPGILSPRARAIYDRATAAQEACFARLDAEAARADLDVQPRG